MSSKNFPRRPRERRYKRPGPLNLKELKKALFGRVHSGSFKRSSGNIM